MSQKPAQDQVRVADASALCIAMVLEEMTLGRLVNMNPEKRAQFAKTFAGLEREQFIEALGYMAELAENRQRMLAQMREARDSSIGRA